MENGVKFWIIGIVILILIVLFVGRVRIIEKILFSNKSYAKQIEVKTYILTQEQVVNLFKDPQKEPMRLIVDELNKIDKLYFVARVKNLGSSNAWGVLNFQVPSSTFPIKITILNIQRDYCDFVICISGLLVSQKNDTVVPSIKYKWSELYTK